MNDSPSHLPPIRAGVSAGAGSGGRRAIHGGGGIIRSAQWPGFPCVEANNKTLQAEDMEAILGGGMTIDSLLQQLRALS